nr:MFS transporter [Ktedonobacterales bacterium]
LNALQLVLNGTALEGTIFLLQVPTGVLADVYSRRRCIILGIAFLGAGALLQGAFPRFETILLSSVLAGLGYSFLSGAEEAWIAGEVGEERVAHVFLRGSQVGQVGALLGVVIGTGLGTIQLNLPILTGGVLLVALAGLLPLIMPETRFQRGAHLERPTWNTLSGTLRDAARLVRRSPVLLTILAVTAFYGMSSEGFDRLNVAHFLRDYTLPPLGPLKPVVWFGIMRVVGMLLSLAAMELARRRLDMRRPVLLARALFVLNALLLASVVVFGLAGGFVLALAAFWSVTVLRSVNDPLYNAWLTRNTAPGVRATVISMSGQMDALGQIVGGPVVGVIGTVRSLRAALVATGVTLFPALLLYARALRKGHVAQAPAPEEEEAPASAEAGTEAT